MRNLVFDNAQNAFEFLYDHIMRNGHYDTINGTKCCYHVGFIIENPLDNHINTSWRKWKKDYAEKEYQWYKSGDPSAKEIEKHAKIWSKMYDPNDESKRVNSNYGYQWLRKDQLRKTISQLANNNGTRQAWITIFDGKEKDDYSYDTPCTLNVGFKVRVENGHKYVDMDVIMRSNDLVYGFCNDQYCWSRLLEELCKIIPQYSSDFLEGDMIYEPGRIYWFASDMHIYQRHWEMKK